MPSRNSYDFAVIGAGIAGASVACELAARGRVVLVEQEAQPGHHSTGRSAAMLIVNYGPPEVVALTQLSAPFLRAPPPGFADAPLLKDCGCLLLGEFGDAAVLDSAQAEAASYGLAVQRLARNQVARMVPPVRQDAICGGLWDPTSSAIDVHALHTGFLRAFKRRGGELRLDAPATGFLRRNGAWRFAAGRDPVEAAIIVNAAGAWAQAVGEAMGTRVRGITPYRRTAALATLDGDVDVQGWPLVLHVGEEFYCKPEGGRLLVSPGDRTKVEPQDVQPDEYDVAVAVDRIERVMDVSVQRITHRWAGLRTFAPDGRPVVGFDPDVEGLFWLAGQGGAGIMTSPALARVAAAQATGERADELLVAGLGMERLLPSRLNR